MPFIPDLTDPPYLDEVGWFLYHEKYGRLQFGGSYDEERLAYSRLLRDEVLSYCGHDEQWLREKTVVSIGCGCTGDLRGYEYSRPEQFQGQDQRDGGGQGPVLQEGGGLPAPVRGQRRSRPTSHVPVLRIRRGLLLEETLKRRRRPFTRS
jgi:hypothetical protein